MSKIQVVDRFLNEIMEYPSENDIELCKVIEYKRYSDNEDKPNAPLVTVKLDNGVELNNYDNGFDVFVDSKRIVYAPVYEVETFEKEGNTIYEEEGLIGFVNKNYDYADFIEI